MSHTAFKIDTTPLSPDDPRYQQRLDSQHRLFLAPGLLVVGAVTGGFLALPFAVRTDGVPLSIIPAGVASVLVSLGIGFIILGLVQGVARLLPAFWQLHSSIDELPMEQRISWYLVEFGLLLLGVGAGFGLCFLIA
jgi:hypothetical protein